MMQAVASLLFSAVPMSLYLWTVWLMDRYDREPIRLLLLNFFWGAVGAVLFGILFSIITSSMVGSSEFTDTVVIAPFIEEITKGVFLLWTVRDRRFDNITDGVVYGMAIGLGFGMTENFLYFVSATTPEEWVMLVVIRTFFSAVMHAMSTGLFGAFVGVTKFNLRRWKIPLRSLGLIVAMFIHFVWNISVSVNSAAAAGLGAMFILLSIVLIITMMQIALVFENRLIIHELAEESSHGVIPASHLNYLPYSSKRKMLGWLSPAVDRRTYVQLATRLAFRKSQSRFCDGREKEEYLEEVESLREQITHLLARDLAPPSERLY